MSDRLPPFTFIEAAIDTRSGWLEPSVQNHLKIGVSSTAIASIAGHPDAIRAIVKGIKLLHAIDGNHLTPEILALVKAPTDPTYVKGWNDAIDRTLEIATGFKQLQPDLPLGHPYVTSEFYAQRGCVSCDQPESAHRRKP